jgi:hypothetical protein
MLFLVILHVSEVFLMKIQGGSKKHVLGKNFECQEMNIFTNFINIFSNLQLLLILLSDFTCFLSIFNENTGWFKKTCSR